LGKHVTSILICINKKEIPETFIADNNNYHIAPHFVSEKKNANNIILSWASG
jgi:hypothetical protein